MKRIRVAIVLFVVICAMLLVGHVRVTAITPKHVLVIGDSLIAQAEPSIRFFMDMDGKVQTDFSAHGGFANCDLLAANGLSNPKLATLLAQKHYDALVVSYSGNDFTPCTGGKTGDPLYDLYTHDAVKTQQLAIFFHVPVVGWVLDPAVANTAALIPRLNQFYALMPRYWKNARVIDGSINITPNNKVSLAMPCVLWELKDSQCVKGQIRVRADDGAHFYCALPTADGCGCRVYSSGETRFALNIVGPTRKFLGL